MTARIDFQSLKRADIFNVLERDGIKLKGNGNERMGPCPKCGGNDRFHAKVHNGIGYWFCRSCYYDVTGHVWHDVIEYYQWRDGVGVVEAASELGGMPMSPYFPPQKTYSKPAMPPPESDITRWKNALARSSNAQMFLAGKNISDTEIDCYDLGFQDDWWAGPAITIPIREPVKDESGKFKMALRNVQRRLLVPREDQPKYMNPSGIGAWPLGLDTIAGETTIAINEGSFKKIKFDVIMPTLGIVAKQAFMPVYGVDNLAKFKTEWYERHFSHLENVYIILDPDVNPYELSWVNELANTIKGKVRGVFLALKPDDCIARGQPGIDAIMRAIKMAVPISKKGELD